MSTSYRCKPVLPWKTLLDGLETAGLKIEQSAADSDETHKVLCDPESGHYLHASTGNGTDPRGLTLVGVVRLLGVLFSRLISLQVNERPYP